MICGDWLGKNYDHKIKAFSETVALYYKKI